MSSMLPTLRQLASVIKNKGETNATKKKKTRENINQDNADEAVKWVSKMDVNE